MENNVETILKLYIDMNRKVNWHPKPTIKQFSNTVTQYVKSWRNLSNSEQGELSEKIHNHYKQKLGG